MENMVGPPVMTQPGAGKVPDILTIDEVVAQEESKRSTQHNEEIKLDFNKL